MTLLELAFDPQVVAASVLLVGAAASGVSLYATLGGLGLASRLSLIPALPPGLTGLENGLVIATAGVLLLIEAAADREPAFAGMWHTLHALAKPIAAALLCLSALAATPASLTLAACVMAAAVALAFHAIRYGARVAYRMPDAPRGSVPWTLGEAALAVALLRPLRFPQAAPALAVALLVFMLAAGPIGFRAFRLGVAAQRARLRAFLGEGGWSDVSELPGSLRRAIPPTPFAGTPPRATRAGVLGAPRIGRFQAAWLVADARGHRLLARTWRGSRHVEIRPPLTVELRPGAWADLLEIGTEAGELRILLLKDGPAPALVTRSLASEPVMESRVHS